MSDDQPTLKEVREPELRQPAPRSIRIRQKCRINRWATLLMMVVLPGAAAGFGFYQQAKWTKLKDHGIETVATLIEKQDRAIGKRKHPPRGYYKYIVDGVTHRLMQDFSDAEYRDVPLGHRQPVVYLADQPAYSATRKKLSARADSPEAVVVWVLGGGIGLVLLGTLIYTEWVRARRVRLARYGTAVVATRLEVEPAAINSYNKRWKIAYWFMHEGTKYSGGGNYRSKAVADLQESPAEVAVLFDPENPNRSELYAGVKQWVVAVAAD